VSLSANYLIVAGGGGGSTAGGGAGGMLTGSGLAIDTASTYLVTVGAGGAGATTDGQGTSGANSAFSVVPTTAIGGGGAGGYSATASLKNGLSGGSGGGGGTRSGAGSGVAGAGTAGQGNAGGSGYDNGVSGSPGGGGGGVGAVGGNASATSIAGNGGVGLASSISGTSTYYAGGGGGSSPSTNGTGGNGGGGAGKASGTSNSGTANTGGGGGGNFNTPSDAGGQGGSGIVIISYAGSTQLMAGGTVTISGGNVIHTFTSSGYLTPLTYVGNSLRFRASNSAYLSRTPPTAGSRTTWTWSAWVKRGDLSRSSGAYGMFGCAPSGEDTIRFDSATAGGQINYYVYTGGYVGQLNTTAVYRDPAAWYHVVCVWDTTNATSTERMRLYVNGARITAFGTATYPSLNAVSNINNSVATQIGWYSPSSGNGYYDGEMTEIRFIDGQALGPNSFGTFNSYGVWQPITYGGSYGTNGFYLPMNPGSSTYAAPFNGTSQLISAPANAAFNFTGNFTAECWANTSTITNATQPILFTIGSDASGLVVGFYSGAFYCYMVGSGGLMTSATLPLNQWVHVAWVRVGSVNTLYLNGVANATATNSSTLSSTGGVTVGKTGSSGSTYNYFQGSVSNFRVNNTALYTANFTPPTSPLTAVSGTQLLTLQNATIIDNSTNAFTITNTNSVATVVSYPFNLNKTIDYSPAGNNWTNNNIGTVTGTTLDVMTDVPTLTSTTAANYCTLNPLAVSPSSGAVLSNGNLKQVGNSGGGYQGGTLCTMGVSSGQWYWETTVLGLYATNAYQFFGIAPQNYRIPSSGTDYITTIPGKNYYGGSLYLDGAGTTLIYYNNGTNSNINSGFGNVAVNDVIQIAFDVDSGKVWFGKNGTWYNSGVPSSGTNPTFTLTTSGYTPFLPCSGTYITADSQAINFGQQPFVYTPPTGFVALNTYNL
jgi:hypothetical protein